MKILKRNLGFLLLCLNCSAYGQINCSKDILVGHWRQVKSIPGVHTNVDSLKYLIRKSGKTIGTLEFQADGIYKYTFLEFTDKKDHKYFVDTLICEIILGTKKNARIKSNLKIIYLDEQFLIFTEDNNPKGDETYLMTKFEVTE